MNMALRKFGFALALWLLIIGTAAAGELTAKDAQALRADIAAMMKAFERGDAEPLIARTHPSLKALMGGDEAFAHMTREAVKQLRDVRILSSEVGTPTRTYPAGKEEVCFVPRVSVMEFGGKRIKGTTFMIAVRTVGGTTWSYLDGAGLRDHPEALKMFLPALEQGVPLPANEIEEVE